MARIEFLWTSVRSQTLESTRSEKGNRTNWAIGAGPAGVSSASSASSSSPLNVNDFAGFSILVFLFYLQTFDIAPYHVVLVVTVPCLLHFSQLGHVHTIPRFPPRQTAPVAKNRNPSNKITLIVVF